MGRVLSKAERYAEAEEHLLKASMSKPNHRAMFELARLYEKTERLAQAREIYQAIVVGGAVAEVNKVATALQRLNRGQNNQ